MPITIQEIIASDTISQFVNKTNFNFDQLLLNGGGPGGPIGPKGPTGPGGGRGPKGSTWYEDQSTVSPGLTPNAAPPTSTPFNKDYYLQFNGQVWEYNGTLAVWEITTIDLQGPPGAAGGGGGFGLTIGSPVINQSNIRYNGPIGDNGNGANNINEGVPSVLIGGVTSLTAPLANPLINFTGAYIVPDAIISGNSSYLTSLLIHQKDSQSRGIVFHGGAAIGSGDNFEQTDPGQLSNIRLDVDDTLVLSVPKPPTTTSTQSQMLGFQVLTPLRAQQFFAGSDILIQSGTGPGTIDFPSQHSNIEINVGTGGTAGDGSLFRTVTQGFISATLLEAGNSTRIPLVTNQSFQTGNWQVQAGEIRLVSSTAKDLGLYSGKNLRLNTLDSGGAFAGTGSIILSGGSGGIALNSTNGGNVTASAENIGFTANDEVSIFAGDNMGLNAQDAITIKVDDGDITITQNAIAPPIGLIGKNISIRNRMQSSFGANTLGNIQIESNNNIYLKQESVPVSGQEVKLTLDFSPAYPTQASTKFVGRQSWNPSGNGSGVPINLGQPVYQWNYLSTGNSNLDVIDRYECFRKVSLGGVFGPVDFEKWVAVSSSLTSSSSYEPAQAMVRLQNENTYTPPMTGGSVTTPWNPYYPLNSSDRTIGFQIYSEENSQSANLGQYRASKKYFSTNKNKTAIGNMFVWNRSNDNINTNKNNMPATDLRQPASSPENLAQNTVQYGWNTLAQTLPTNTSGMPSQNALSQSPPFVQITFAPTYGNSPLSPNGGPWYGNLPSSNPDSLNVYDFTEPSGTAFHFPIGAYPGQKILLRIQHYSCRYTSAIPGSSSKNFTSAYGDLEVLIPKIRRRSLTYGTNAWSDWYGSNGGGGATSTDNGYHIFKLDINSTEVLKSLMKEVVVEMTWDGTITTFTTDGLDGLQPVPTPPSESTIEVQNGWIVTSKALANGNIQLGGGYPN